MALSLQQHGVPIHAWRAWLGRAAPLSRITEEEQGSVLNHMLGQDILFEADGRYVFGPEGEKRYGKRNLMDMYAVFSTPAILRVFWGSREIGSIDAWFAQQDDALTFVLAGRPWRMINVQWKRGTCTVEPAVRARLPRWMGSPKLLSFELCQTMRQILEGDDVDPWWTKRATDVLEEMRSASEYLRDEPFPLQADGANVKWHTWAGGKANALLAALLHAKLGDRVSSDNTCVTFSSHAADSDVAIRQAIRELAQPGSMSVEAAMPYVSERARSRLSKFQPCLPEDIELRFLADRLFDVEHAKWVVTPRPQPIGNRPFLD